MTSAGAETLQEAAGSATASLAPCPGSARTSKPSQFVDVSGTLFFTADDGTHGQELWKSDGTKAGTVLVRDINPGNITGSNPASLTAIRGTLFFTANDGTHGRELWKSDGTKAGTVLAKNITPDTGDDDGGGPTHLTAVGGRLFFAADDATHGKELWKSDGTRASTVLVKDIDPSGRRYPASSSPTDLTAVGRKLFFIADNRRGAMELWTSNGTKAGTVLVKNMGFTNDYDYGPSNLTAFTGKLYFSDDNDDDTQGQELWTSNGTNRGTVLVKDINPRPSYGGSYPSSLTPLGGTLFFTADDDSHGWELWMSDGSNGGTVLVEDINPGDATSTPSFLTAMGGTLFFTAQDGVHGRELWTSGGTGSGTVLVKDINPGDGSSPSSLAEVGGALYFTADDGIHGQELWKSNGTSGGTVLVRDIRRCSGQYRGPSSLTRVGSRLFFAANDGVHGQELWKSNGTKDGTVLVKDIKRGRRP